MSEKNFIRVLNQSDQIEYDLLVKDAFGTAVGFTAENSTLTWTPTDSYYSVLGLFHHGNLKAMMRLEWIESETEYLMKIDENKLPFSLDFPIGYLAKAATATDSKGHNFNAILRYQALKIFQTWDVSMVLGVIAEGSPREKTMRDIGYEFFKKEKKWNGNFRSDRQILLGFLLNREKISSAIDQLGQRVGNLVFKYPLQFDVREIRMVPKTRLVFPWHKKSS